MTTNNNWIYYLFQSGGVTFTTSLQAFTFLMYPIFGLIADVCVTWYRIIKLSFCLALISSLIVFAGAILLIFKPQLIAQKNTLQ